MKIRAFLDKKGVSLSPKKYFIDAMSAMALGLFASLLIGTIFSTLAKYIPWEAISLMATYANNATGAVLGIAIGLLYTYFMGA